MQESPNNDNRRMLNDVHRFLPGLGNRTTQPSFNAERTDLATHLQSQNFLPSSLHPSSSPFSYSDHLPPSSYLVNHTIHTCLLYLDLSHYNCPFELSSIKTYNHV